MKTAQAWIKKHAGIIIVIFFFIVHLAIINNYGLTWDFHFHFFGGGKLLGLDWQQLEPRWLPYVEPDPRKAWTLPYGPLMSIPPVASFLLLYKTWHLLPADSAYNLPIILWGVAGIGIFYLFLKEALNRRIAILGALFLALTPRYFGDLHNNMKDIPSAVIFALNMWLLWRLVKFHRPLDLLWAIVAFAAAFSVKINSIYIPIVFAVWLALLHFLKPETRRLKLFFWYFLLAPLAAFAIWAIFWPDPIKELAALVHFTFSTNNIEVLLNGSWYCSGKDVPWYYPFWYLAITTPIPILLFFILELVMIGIKIMARGGIPFRRIVMALASKTGWKKSDLDLDDARTRRADLSAHTSILLLLWFFLPLTRYLIPTIGVIDGIRHFEEALFPIAALAAVSLDATLSFIEHKKKTMKIALLVGIFAWLAWNIVAYHPFEITYFNELVGGAKGALGKYDLDYWGGSQKAAITWINKHAPQGAKVNIVMSADVAAIYLRPDLLANVNSTGFDASDFVVMLNRQSFYYRFFYAYEYLLRHTPAYTVSVQGAPLVWIFDNRTDNKTPRQTPWWEGEDPCIIKYWRGEHL